jgi:hypothetical protein
MSKIKLKFVSKVQETLHRTQLPVLKFLTHALILVIGLYDITFEVTGGRGEI